jgi:hypothetical protein
MTTSGTAVFAMDRDSLIGAALRLVQAFGAQDSIPSSDLANCAQALNVLAKALAIEGLPLWCVQEVSIPLLTGIATYNISTVANSPLPLRVLSGFVRDAAGNDSSIEITSRGDYNLLGQKSASGVPNQAYYNPQLTGGILSVYSVPADSTYTLYLSLQRQIQDFNLAVDNPDFPQEAYQLLKWCLADEIALEYETPLDVRQEINQKANGYKDKLFNFSREDVSTFFAPSGNWGASA